MGLREKNSQAKFRKRKSDMAALTHTEENNVP